MKSNRVVFYFLVAMAIFAVSCSDIKTVEHDNGTYVGQMNGDDREGQGTYTWNDGEKYIGEWKNDERNGKGKCIYADGTVYEGDWKDDVPVNK